MYITKEELEKRLNKTSVDIVTRERVVRKTTKKNEAGEVVEKGEDRLTNNERTLIGILGKEDNHKDVAELMGVSAQTVSNASRGLVSPTIGVDKELRDSISTSRESIAKDKLESEKKIQDQLITNLAAALGHVANNLDNTDASEASKIAVDMSKILDRVSGDRNERHGNRTAIIINVPAMKEEKSYQSITV
jgi:transcriptional regulator with XRE-family HTH domain